MSSTRDITLTALTATMESATLLLWRVAPGDTVAEGQPIAEVATDKVDMDIEAPFAGIVVSLAAAPGDDVPLGGVLATLETEADDLLGGLDLGNTPPAESLPADTTPAPPVQVAAAETHIVAASPPARKRARDLGIDLSQVPATGVRGQVTSSDIDRFVAGSPPAPAAPPTPRPAEPAAQERSRGVRRATANIMERSAQIPQFTLWRTLMLDGAAAIKGSESWTTVFVRGLAGALHAHPELNAKWDEAERDVVPFGQVAVGLAVDRPGIGLVVATIGPDRLADTAGLDTAVRSTAERAKGGKLRPTDLEQASITLSNLGGLGVERFNALLFPPQPAILAAGRIRPAPVVARDGGLKVGLICEVGLTVDHRVADGADGARFLDTFVSLVQSAD